MITGTLHVTGDLEADELVNTDDAGIVFDRLRGLRGYGEEKAKGKSKQE
ncbi:MAG: hypothetical protein IH940_03430 [Acidobacteria bacterium]|nr:hypothetical protein [Acidobacteriota bacterium]